MKAGRWAALALTSLIVLGGCSSSKKAETKPSDSGKDEAAAVEDTVTQSVDAERAKDAPKFLALWTDKGLEEFDSGSREEISSGQAPLGEDPVELLSIGGTKVNGDKATTDVEAAPVNFHVAKILFSATFSLIKQDGKWLIDGFNFKGSPPAVEGTEVVGVKAVEYGFVLDRSELPSDVAFKFTNGGKQQHELVLYSAPAGTDLPTAKAAVENVDGGELNNLPAGYKADHLSFTQPGESIDVTFAEPLAPGEYFFVCYIPDGGFNEQFEPVNPNGQPHVKLGMINKFTVA